MANVPSPHQYEIRANKRIQTAIDELVERASDEAFGEYGGQLVRFTHRWHPIDPELTAIEARITNAYFDQGDEGGDWHLLFEVVARNPHNGHDETITRWSGGLEFI
jgi:hypothetical protein